jgi:hypothetical protein
MLSERKGILLLYDNVGPLSYLLTVLKEELAHDYNVHVDSVQHMLDGCDIGFRIHLTIMFNADRGLARLAYLVHTVVGGRILFINDTAVPGLLAVAMQPNYDKLELSSNYIDPTIITKYLQARLPVLDIGSKFSKWTEFDKYTLVVLNLYPMAFVNYPDYMAYIHTTIPYIEQLCRQGRNVILVTFNRPGEALPGNLRVTLQKHSGTCHHDQTSAIDLLVQHAENVVATPGTVELLALLLGKPVFCPAAISNMPGVNLLTNLSQLESGGYEPCSDGELHSYINKNNILLTGDMSTDAVTMATVVDKALASLPTQLYYEAYETVKQANHLKLWLRSLETINCLFVRTPKNASTSITAALFDYLKEEVKGTVLNRHYPHMTAYEMQQVDPIFFAKAYKFTVIRNPLERMVASWHYCNRVTNQYNFSFKTLLELCHFIKEPFHDPIDIVFKPQLDYVTDPSGNIIVDELIPLEHLGEAWPELCNRLGIRCELPFLNMNAVESGLMDAFDEKTLALAKEIYAEDIKLYEHALSTWRAKHGA